MQAMLNDKLNELNNFSMEPSGEIWNEIEKELHPQRKRRIAAWWWMGALLLLSGTGFWMTKKSDLKYDSAVVAPKTQQAEGKTSSSQSNTAKEDANISASHGNAEHQDSHAKPSLDIAAGEHVNSSHSHAHAAHHDGNVQHQDAHARPSHYIVSGTHDIVSGEDAHARESLVHARPTHDIAAGTHYIVSGEDVHAEQSHDIEAGSPVKILATEAKIPTKTNNTVKTEIEKQITKPETTIPTKKEEHQKEIQWRLVFGAGSSVITESALLRNGGKTAAPYSNTISGTTSSFPGILSYKVSLPENGITFNLGISATKNLDKHFTIDAGLNYRFIRNNQWVKDGTPATLDTAQTYIAGNTIQMHNISHRAEIPINIGYIFNPNAKNKIGLLVGTSLSYVLSQNWLLTDKYNNEYYYNTSAEKKVQWYLQTGVSINLKNNLNISLSAKQSLTPIHIGYEGYSALYNVQVGIPVSFKKNKK